MIDLFVARPEVDILPLTRDPRLCVEPAEVDLIPAGESRPAELEFNEWALGEYQQRYLKTVDDDP